MPSDIHRILRAANQLLEEFDDIFGLEELAGCDSRALIRRLRESSHPAITALLTGVHLGEVVMLIHALQAVREGRSTIFGGDTHA